MILCARMNTLARAYMQISNGSPGDHELHTALARHVQLIDTGTMRRGRPRGDPDICVALGRPDTCSSERWAGELAPRRCYD